MKLAPQLISKTSYENLQLNDYAHNIAKLDLRYGPSYMVMTTQTHQAVEMIRSSKPPKSVITVIDIPALFLFLFYNLICFYFFFSKVKLVFKTKWHCLKTMIKFDPLCRFVNLSEHDKVQSNTTLSQKSMLWWLTLRCSSCLAPIGNDEILL